MNVHTLSDNSIKRVSVAVLCLLLLVSTGLLLCACYPSPDEPIEPAPLRLVSNLNTSIFSIVYPLEGGTQEIMDAAQRLQMIMEKRLGVDVSVSSDAERSVENSEWSYEILIGKTNRAESQEVYQTLEGDTYTVRMKRHKIVIAGNCVGATLQAVEHFIADVLRCDSMIEDIATDDTLAIATNYHFEGTYQNQENPTDTAALLEAPYRARNIHVVAFPQSLSDQLTLTTLQGLMAAACDDQLLIHTDEMDQYLSQLSDAQVDTQDCAGEAWSLEKLLKYYSSRLDGYLLCDPARSPESMYVAINLAHALRAVVVTPENMALAEHTGLTMIMDVTEKDDDWLRQSEYFATLSTTVAVEQSPEDAPTLADYAVMKGCYYGFYDGRDGYSHQHTYQMLQSGAVLIGWNNTLGIEDTVDSLTEINVGLIPARGIYNLSVMSGFSKLPQQDGADDPTIWDTPNEIHTVCLVLTDGDVIQSMLSGLSDWDEEIYALLDKGVLAHGISPAYASLMAPWMSAIQQEEGVAENLFLQIRGIEHWLSHAPSEAYREQVMAEALKAAGKTGVHYLHVHDTELLSQGLIRSMLKATELRGVICDKITDGGDMACVGGVPVVAVRYDLTVAREEDAIREIADAINAATTDATQPEAYSLVAVSVFQLREVCSLLSMLDADVEAVSLSEFMARIHANSVVAK